MKLCRHEVIARFIADHEGRPCSTRTVKRYIAQPDHPLPVRRSGNVDIIESDQLVKWLAEEGERREQTRKRNNRPPRKGA